MAETPMRLVKRCAEYRPMRVARITGCSCPFDRRNTKPWNSRRRPIVGPCTSRKRSLAGWLESDRGVCPPTL